MTWYDIKLNYFVSRYSVCFIDNVQIDLSFVRLHNEDETYLVDVYFTIIEDLDKSSIKVRRMFLKKWWLFQIFNGLIIYHIYIYITNFNISISSVFWKRLYRKYRKLYAYSGILHKWLVRYPTFFARKHVKVVVNH